MAMDPTLRRSSRQWGYFLSELIAADVIVLTTEVKETAGVFFVARKDGMLRLIFDTRRPNAHFMAAPKTRLASGESLSDLESPPGQPVELRAGDVEVCFYQFSLPDHLSELLLPADSAEVFAHWAGQEQGRQLMGVLIGGGPYLAQDDAAGVEAAALQW